MAIPWATRCSKSWPRYRGSNRSHFPPPPSPTRASSASPACRSSRRSGSTAAKRAPPASPSSRRRGRTLRWCTDRARLRLRRVPAAVADHGLAVLHDLVGEAAGQLLQVIELELEGAHALRERAQLNHEILDLRL